MSVLEQPDDGPDGVLAAEVVVEPQVVDAALTQLVQDSQTGGGRPRDETGTAVPEAPHVIDEHRGHRLARAASARPRSPG